MHESWHASSDSVCVLGGGKENEWLMCPWFPSKRWTLLVQGGMAYWASSLCLAQE